MWYLKFKRKIQFLKLYYKWLKSVSTYFVKEKKLKELKILNRYLFYIIPKLYNKSLNYFIRINVWKSIIIKILTSIANKNVYGFKINVYLLIYI